LTYIESHIPHFILLFCFTLVLYLQFFVLPSKTHKPIYRLIIISIISVGTFVLSIPYCNIGVHNGIIKALSIILLLGQIFFEIGNFIFNKDGYILFKKTTPLSYFALKKILNIHLSEISYPPKQSIKKHLENDENILEFYKANLKNTRYFTVIANRGFFILLEVFLKTYESFQTHFLTPIYRISKGDTVEIPKSIVTKIRDKLEEKFDVQKNTSIYPPRAFFEINKNDIKKNNSRTNTERIFLIDFMQVIEQLKKEIHDLSQNNDDDLPFGLGYIFGKETKIPYFLWVCEWHMKRSEKMCFLSEDNADSILSELSKKESQIYKDFSINERQVCITQKNNWFSKIFVPYTNENKQESIILINSTSIFKQLDILPDKIQFFSIIIENNLNSKYHMTYEILKENSIQKSDISRLLKEVKFKNKNGEEKNVFELIPLI